jgi:CheY-like chemotaxis protein
VSAVVFGGQEGTESGAKSNRLADDCDEDSTWPGPLQLIRRILEDRGHGPFDERDLVSINNVTVSSNTGSYDVVLTDIHMPGMDGIEATQAIRARETETRRRRTPIVALTADALETGMRACKDAGMDGFLTKPVDPTQLDDMFKSLVPEAPASQSAAA